MPEYENDQHRAHELGLMQSIGEKHGLQLYKLPKRFVLDAAGFKNGDLHCFFEFKRRNVAHDTYPTMMLDLFKVIGSAELLRVTKKPCHLVVEWNDMIGTCNLQAYKRIDIGGRTDRGDPNDFGLVVHYPIEAFRTLEFY